MKGRMVALAAVAVAAVVALAAVGTWRWAAATGNDVNDDGIVDLKDILGVISAYGQAVPTPTPVPVVVGDRAFVDGGDRLINTSDGSTVATYSSVGFEAAFRCDGAVAALVVNVGATQRRIDIIDTVTGSALATSPLFTLDFNSGAVLPCPLVRGGGRFIEGAPAQNRAVAWTGLDAATAEMMVFDLTTGEVIFSDILYAPQGPPILNCANDTVLYRNAAATAWELVRLADGASVGTIPVTSIEPTC